MVSRRLFLRHSTAGLLALLAGCGGRTLAETSASTANTVSTLPIAPPTPLSTATAGPTVAAPAPTATVTATATRAAPPTPSQPYLVVARGSDPAALTRAALEALGGIERFVKSGDDVIIKPNICTASYGPEFAATTNPQVVAAVVQLCLAAGAARVRVMDSPFGGTANQAYKVSEIADAVEQAGGQMELMSTMKYAEVAFPATARDIKSWKVYQDVLKANVLINIPIAKHHSLARVTLGMKNLLGVVANRNGMHWNLDQRLADLSTLVRPTLTIVDGVRVLMQNGPTGGRLEYVRQANTLIASHDTVAADTYAAQLFFEKTPQDIGYIRLGGEMGLGRVDVENLNVQELQL